MFPNYIEHLGHHKNIIKTTNKERKTKEKIKKIKNGNNSTHHEPLSEEWIGRRS